MLSSRQHLASRRIEASSFAWSRDFPMYLLAPPSIAALTGGHMLGGQ